jgi:O-antigen ligase
VSSSQNQSASRPLELAVAAHVAIFTVGVSWAFGGNADWVRTPISIWGSIGILLTAAILADRNARSRILPGTTRWIWPVIALSLIAAVSCMTPGFRTISFGNETLMMPVRVPWWVPSSARPTVTVRSIWLFDGLFFSCLNVALAIGRKRVIRIILATVVANALALSILGTVQKLVGSPGIYFGSVKSPQTYFFSSFVYDNHWGAFIILMLGACAGLILRYAHGVKGEGFFRGPAFFGLVAACIIAVSVPLSGSRACTILLGAMTTVALIHGAPRILNAMNESGISRGSRTAAIAFAAIALVGGFWFVAGDVIEARASKTKEQVTAMWIHGGIGSRSILYHDTWRMAGDRILFGWGMGTFPTVFALYNSQESKIDHIPVVYHDAHSDWIQSVSEIGLVGTALIGVAVLLPVASVRRWRMTPIPYFLIAGMLLVAAYAWVEFPFGNVSVVLAWWLSFFCAIQYIRLTEKEIASRSRH